MLVPGDGITRSKAGYIGGRIVELARAATNNGFIRYVSSVHVEDLYNLEHIRFLKLVFGDVGFDNAGDYALNLGDSGFRVTGNIAVGNGEFDVAVIFV